MTDQTPVPPPPPPPAPPAPPVAPATPPTAGYAPPPPPPPADVAPATSGRGGGGGKKLLVGGLAAAIVLGGGYGAYAVYDRLDGGGPQPHDVLPASTQAYVRLDLDPSASQKINLFKLIRKVPDLADEVGITSDKADIRELVFRDAIASECDDVDYDKDVEPWLGDRIGVGADIEKETFLVAVQTTDEDKSRAGIKKLFACSGESYGIAFLDGYAILAPKQADVDRAVAATKDKGSLGDDKDFAADFDQLGNQGVASAWADLSAIAKIPAVAEAAGPEIGDLSKLGTVATALRADGSAIEMAILSDSPTTSGSKAKATPLGDLPADTVVALSIAGVGDQISKGYDSLLEELDGELGSGGIGFSPDSEKYPTGLPTADADTIAAVPTVPEPSVPTLPPDDLGLDDFGTDDEELDPLTPTPGETLLGGGVQGFIDQLEQSTGLQLPGDLVTLFGDSLTLAVGGKNLEKIPTLSGPEGLADLDVALSLRSDQAKALDLVKRLASLAADAGIPLVASPTDDGAVLATNQGAADAVADADGSLGDDATFKSVVPDGDSAFGGFYVNIGTILDKLLAADPPDDVRQGIESAKALSAVGVSSKDEGGSNLTRLRVAFK